MSCVTSIEGNQTEFEFYQQLMRSADSDACCGPKLDIRFSNQGINSLSQLLTVAQLSPRHLDSLKPVMLDSKGLRLTQCSRHWLQLEDLLHKASHWRGREDWNQLSHYIFKLVCLMNGWDEKEIINYVS